MATKKNEEQGLISKVGEVLESIRLLVNYMRHKSDNGLRTPRRAGGLSSFKMDYTPNPYSGRAVRTTSESLEDIMMREGRMSREVWEQLRGLEYDSYSIDDDDILADTQEHYDEFEQSSFASYYDFKEARAKRAKEQEVVTAARQSDSNVTTPVTESTGVETSQGEQNVQNVENS